MERIEFIALLREGFRKNLVGDLLDERKEELLYDLYAELVEANKITNLTAITEPKAVILKHFVDCATICNHIESGARVIDVGCGAGFPSLPLAILRDDVSVLSLDSTGKKIDFIKRTAGRLGLGNVEAVCARAEEFVVDNRESFDVCTSRAVARLNVLSEICIPLVKSGGLFLAMKSNKGDEEYVEASRGIKTLGCSFVGKMDYELSFEGEIISREIYTFKKTAKTPPQYPRKYSQILKKPL